MEEQQIPDEGGNKKIRHRKKQLFNSILEQMEFYFSDSNISKDRFLAQLIQTDPYVDLSVFLKFNKIRTLTTNIEDICKALRKSEKLQLSEDNLKVCRVTPVQEKTNQDECTIYVERVPADVEHDWLKNIFSKFGTVDYVSIPKYKHNKMIKGFAFIEFSKPDEAQKVLEYFESIGCKLPTKMPPDQLVSIATFEPDNSEKDVRSHNNSTINKQQDEIEEGVESKTDDDVSTTTDNDTNKKSTENLSEESEKTEADLQKKRKMSENDDAETKKKVKNENEDATNDENEEVVNNEEENGNGEENIDKKKRKRKKSHKKTTIDIKQIGLKVLSKREWKQLRNKYLNLQRQKMQNLKEHLNRTRFANNVHYTENIPSDRNSTKPQNDEPETAPRFKYTPGTIIHFELPEECSDIKKFKANIRSHSGVEFVDIAIGNNQGFIRFTNSDSTDKFLESSFDASMRILQGDEEKQYWDKIIEDREMKLKKETGKKQRGRDKLLRKAEKALGKHIRFDNAE